MFEIPQNRKFMKLMQVVMKCHPSIFHHQSSVLTQLSPWFTTCEFDSKRTTRSTFKPYLHVALMTDLILRETYLDNEDKS